MEYSGLYGLAYIAFNYYIFSFKSLKQSSTNYLLPWASIFKKGLFTSYLAINGWENGSNKLWGYLFFQVLKYVASLLEMPEAELAELSYKNATKLFSYPGSKVHPEAGDIWWGLPLPCSLVSKSGPCLYTREKKYMKWLYITVNVSEIKWMLNQSNATAMLQSIFLYAIFVWWEVVSNKTSKSMVII